MTDVIDPVEINEEQDEAATGEPHPANQPEARLVPVTEAIRYRKRAQSAEQQLESTRSKLDELEHQLHDAQELITSLERRQRIDALLAESDAIDLEAARLLTERIVAEMDEPDVKAAVEDLRRHKPYLFRRSHAARSSSAAVDGARLDADHAAAEARATGDRRDLLRYLRLRRGK